MPTTTTTPDQGSPWCVPVDRFTGPAVVLSAEECRALVTGAASPIPGSVAARAVDVLTEVLDVETLTDVRRAVTSPGATAALCTAVALCQHGETFADASSDDGDGTVLASFLSLAIATARTIVAEDDAVDAAGRPDRHGASWREYVERCGRIALVRSLRAIPGSTTRPDARDAMYRTARADDPSVTAPRAPRRSRSPGAAVANVPQSRAERTRDAMARAAMVTADALGADLDRLIGTGGKAWQTTIVGDPECPIAAADAALPEDERSGHACSLSCFRGGFHAYSRGPVLRPGVAGPEHPDHADVVYVWRPFRCFPEGVAYVRSHAATGTDARLTDAHRVRLQWRPSKARQALTDGDQRYTPTTFRRERGTETVTPERTAAHVAAGGTFDQAVRTTYDGRTWVGHVRQVTATAPSDAPAVKRARMRAVRTVTPQHRAVITLVVDAAILTMFDGQARTAHRDQDGRGYVVTRTAGGILTLVTPNGITTPLPTDTRRMTAAVRAATL